MIDKVTARPWEHNEYRDLIGGDNKIVTVWGLGIAHGQRSEETEANAAHIIKCVNFHEQLVEALHEAIDSMKAFESAPGAVRDEWDFEPERIEIERLFNELAA